VLRSEMSDPNGSRRRTVGYIGLWERCAPPNPGGSLELWTREVARRMVANYDMLVCGPKLQDTARQEECEGVRFVRFPLEADGRLFTIAQRMPFFRDPR
jgi:hypothetical protein